MRRRVRSILSWALAIVVVSVLAACDPLTTSLPWAFGEVERTVDYLQIREAGDVLVDGRSGGGLAGPPPTYAAIIDGAGARDVVESSLRDAAYTPLTHDSETEVSTWTGTGSDHGFAFVIVSVLRAGETGDVNTGNPIELESDATFVSVAVYPK